jgi:hypothetical protein
LPGVSTTTFVRSSHRFLEADHLDDRAGGRRPYADMFRHDIKTFVTQHDQEVTREGGAA